MVIVKLKDGYWKAGYRTGYGAAWTKQDGRKDSTIITIPATLQNPLAKRKIKDKKKLTD